jgi:hypothetical protein
VQTETMPRAPAVAVIPVLRAAGRVTALSNRTGELGQTQRLHKTAEETEMIRATHPVELLRFLALPLERIDVLLLKVNLAIVCAHERSVAC